jgi:DNA-binding transcriptional ArsR family regulator
MSPLSRPSAPGSDPADVALDAGCDTDTAHAAAARDLPACDAAAPDAVTVLLDPARVRQALSPLRIELLRHLKRPGSASGLATRLGVSRQKLNYHLRKLEELDLIRLVEVRRRRGFEERLFRVASRALVVAPEVLGDIDPATGPDDSARQGDVEDGSPEPGPEWPDELQDRLSSAYLVAAASRLVGDVAAMRGEARETGTRLATATQELEIRFRSPARLRAFTDDLAVTLAELALRYDRPADSRSRPYHVFVGVHPTRAPRGEPTSNRESDHE